MGAAPGTPSQVAATVVSKGSLALHRAPTVLAASFIGKDELRPTRNHPERSGKWNMTCWKMILRKLGLSTSRILSNQSFLGASSSSSAPKYQLNIYYQIICSRSLSIDIRLESWY
jgi:hypothetical protein